MFRGCDGRRAKPSYVLARSYDAADYSTCLLPIHEGQSTGCGPQRTHIGKAEVDHLALGNFEKNIRIIVGVVGQMRFVYKDLTQGVHKDLAATPSPLRGWERRQGSFEDVCCDKDGCTFRTIGMSATGHGDDGTLTREQR
jgi:hypothetical protein